MANSQRPLCRTKEVENTVVHSAVHVNNKNSVNTTIAGSGNIVHNNNSSATTVIVLNISSGVSRDVSPSTHARDICAQISAQLQAEGVTVNGQEVASHLIAADGARYASGGRDLDRSIPNHTPINYVRSITLPWMHRLKPVWGSLVEAISQLSDNARLVSGTPTMTAVVGLGLLAAHGQGIPLAYTAGTLALFTLGNPYCFFRYPDIPHFIIVVDFFDKEVQVPLSDATSSAALRRALMGHHAGKMVVVLLQQRKYELQAIEVTPGSRACSGQALPQGWRNLLQPGSKLSINALVSRIDRDNSSEIVCPACLSSFTPDNADDHSDWLECPACPTMMQISVSGDGQSPLMHGDEIDSVVEDLSEDDVGGGSARLNWSNEETDQGISQSASLLERAISQCRRIRIFNTRLQQIPPWETIFCQNQAAQDTDAFNEETESENMSGLSAAQYFPPDLSESGANTWESMPTPVLASSWSPLLQLMYSPRQSEYSPALSGRSHSPSRSYQHGSQNSGGGTRPSLSVPVPDSLERDAVASLEMFNNQHSSRSAPSSPGHDLSTITCLPFDYVLWPQPSGQSDLPDFGLSFQMRAAAY